MTPFKIYTYILVELLLTIYGEKSLWEHVPKECGKNRFSNSLRIVDGEQAELGQFPWMALIGEVKSKTLHFFCSGALINRFYVLTAAHCGSDGQIVRLGENFKETTRDCDAIICAPPHQDIPIYKYVFWDYNDKSNINDLGLIELKKPAIFNDFVQPICLPHKRHTTYDLQDESLTVAGWGIENVATGKFSKNLTYIMSPVLDNKECDMIYSYKLKEGQLCIGHPDGGPDSCAGDSGGPASLSVRVYGERRMYVMGLVSYGLENCGAGPSVVTDVSFYMPSILEELDKS